MKKASFIVTGRVDAVMRTVRRDSHVTVVRDGITVMHEHGIEGDRHAGPRLSDDRERAMLAHGFPTGTPIANLRQFSAVSAEELRRIADALGIHGVPAGLLGENLVVSGIPRFTELPPGTLLFFRHSGNRMRTAILAVWKENNPCIEPGKVLQERYPDVPGLTTAFPRASAGLRGVLGVVYATGRICAGDEVIAKVPSQRIYEI